MRELGIAQSQRLAHRVSYVIRLGFLDGKVGLVYHVLQSFWFRFLVGAKIPE